MFLRSRTTYVGPKLAALSLRGPSGSARGTESDLDLVVRPLVWQVDSVVSQEVERRLLADSGASSLAVGSAFVVVR